MHLRTTECCGFREICELSRTGTGEDAVKEFCRLNMRARYIGGSFTIKQVLQLHFSHVLFTEVQPKGAIVGYGKRLADYIEEHNLGTIVASTIATNPNSRNRLRGYIWTINKRALTAWHKKHGAGK